MSPSIEPSSSVSETSLTASNPPNWTTMPLASSALGIASPHLPAFQFAHQAAWHEQHDDDDEQPVDEQVGLGEHVAEQLCRQRQQAGAHQRTQERAAASDDRDERDAHREVEFEHRLRLQRRQEDPV